ncbi:unnamed protein product, partial [marine sediment metagenome]
LVIDDGSIDETVSEAEKAGAIVLSLPFHMGGTCAVLTAYLVAVNNDYDFLVKIDADGQHIVEDIPIILRPVLEDEADISISSIFMLGYIGSVRTSLDTISVTGRWFKDGKYIFVVIPHFSR